MCRHTSFARKQDSPAIMNRRVVIPVVALLTTPSAALNIIVAAKVSSQSAAVPTVVAVVRIAVLKDAALVLQASRQSQTPRLSYRRKNLWSATFDRDIAAAAGLRTQ